MKRSPQKKHLLFVVGALCLVLLAVVLMLVNRGQSKTPSRAPQLLSDRQIVEIEEIIIKNQYDSYSVYQEEGGFAIADLPMDLVYAEYLFMLLDEAARVEYIEQVLKIESPYDLSPLAAFGLDRPPAVAVIRYTSGDSLTLVFGAQEPVSRGQYFMLDGGDAVYLMDRSRVVRFLQPLKRFFNLEIVPVRSVISPLSTIQHLTLSGRAFKHPIVVSALDAENEEAIRESLGFGATTHLVTSPRLHKIDQGEAIDVFGSLSGLLNIEVLDYNCDDAALSGYGFDDPLVRAEYVYLKGDGSDPVNIELKTVLYQGGYILLRDDQRVVHRVEKKSFMETSYEKLVSRWFLTPFITDVQSIVVQQKDEEYHFVLSGEDNRSLEASLDGAALNMELFRKFYTLLVSASSDGLLQQEPTQNSQPVLAITFYYRDQLKRPDTMSFSQGSLRRLNVTVNGVTEFTCLERYAGVLEMALKALVKGEDFRTDW